MHYSCIIHGHYWRSVCKSALWGTPEMAAESYALRNCLVSFPEKQLALLSGENDRVMELPRTIMPLNEITRLFRLLFDAHTSARLGNSSARYDSQGFEILFRCRLARTLQKSQESCGSHKNFSPFCLVGNGKVIIENFPNLRTTHE